MENSAQIPLPSNNSKNTPKEVNKFIDINITPDKVYAIAIMTLILTVFGGFIFVASSSPTKDNGGIEANGSPAPDGLGLAKIGGIGNPNVKGASKQNPNVAAGPIPPKKTPKPSPTPSPTNSPTPTPSPTEAPTASPTSTPNPTSNPTSTPYPSFSAFCDASPDTPTVGSTVTWTATATGGSGNFSYEWSGDSGDDSISGSSSTTTKNYTTTGLKSASAKVKDTSSNNEITTQCQVTINQPT
jgi:hypothetical protein